MMLFALFLTTGVVSASQNIPWWNIKAAQQQGPNVCVVEQVPGTHRKYYTECKYWRPRTICGKQTIIKYECCEGYEIVAGQLGCAGVKPLMDVVETARSAGAKKFADFLDQSGIATEIRNGPAVTLFAPSDESFEKYTTIYSGIKYESLTAKKYKNLALYHLVNKRIPSNQWGADMLIDSKLPGHKIRINKYSNGMETVNCEWIMRKNQQAKNGIVHVIDGVLLPERYQNMRITEAITADGRFNILGDILRNSEIIKRLGNSNIAHTFLAPSDEAFQKIPSSRFTKILEDQDTLEALIANHIIVHPICLPGIISEHRAKSLVPQTLNFNCDSHGPTVEGRKLRQDFSQGPDGLVYTVDDVLLPDRAKTVMELADEERLNAFIQIIKDAGLEEVFENVNGFTLFAPSDAAVYSIPTEQLEYFKRDRDAAKEFVLGHAISGRYTTDSVSDNQVVTSLDEQTPLRFQVYRGSVGIENAIIKKADKEGSNGVLHIVNKVLQPNTNSLEHVLQMNGNFSIWLEAMDKMREIQSADFEELRRPPLTTAYTYFVPSDEAFTKLGKAELGQLMGDSAYLAKTLRNHVSNNMMTSGGFKQNLWYAIKTKQSTVDIVKNNDTLKVNGAIITKCDMLNRNGVAHTISKVLLPEDNSHPHHLNRKRGTRHTIWA